MRWAFETVPFNERTKRSSKKLRHPILPADVGELLMRSSEQLAELCGYRGVATAEFLYEPASGTTTFLEVNSRLQVEHTITEAITGADLVQAQIAIGLGWDWTPPSTLVNGHAIELRVNAEDPEQDFRPAPGHVAIFRPPAGPGVRVDSGVTEGSEISEHFDSMIAKIIVWAPTRELCIARARRACLELDAAVEDGATNQAFLLDILRHDEFVQATASTDWLDRAMAAGSVVRVGAEKEALVTRCSHLRIQTPHTSQYRSFLSAVSRWDPPFSSPRMRDIR